MRKYLALALPLLPLVLGNAHAADDEIGSQYDQPDPAYYRKNPVVRALVVENCKQSPYTFSPAACKAAREAETPKK